MYKDGTLKNAILDVSRYDVAGPAGDGGIKHKDFESLYLYHENLDNPEELISKWDHIIDNFELLKGNPSYFLWNNIQPNLHHMVMMVRDNTGFYNLDIDQYNKINSLIQEIFGGIVIFIYRAGTLTPELMTKPNLYPIDLKSTMDDYKGPFDLFKPIFESVGI